MAARIMKKAMRMDRRLKYTLFIIMPSPGNSHLKTDMGQKFGNHDKI
jgi:hypothetical protein